MSNDALTQIQEIATEQMYGMTATETLRWAKAKLERIANIAEAGEPDEDWDGGSAVSGEEMMAEREPVERCPKCGSEDICTQTANDERHPYGCLECDHQFDEPLGEDEESELAGPRHDEDNQAALDAGICRSVEAAAISACNHLADYLNSQEQWNGGDVCEVLAAELNKAGFEVKG